MIIAPMRAEDWPDVWTTLEPIIRAGETYALPRDMSEAAAQAYWCGPDRDVFVVRSDGAIAGSYYLRANQLGPGAHVANAGYAVHGDHQGKGLARAMCAHSLEMARTQGFRAMQFNLVVSSNARAVRLWQHMGFAIIGTVPEAFAHPVHGFVDAHVMFQEIDACSPRSPAQAHG